MKYLHALLLVLAISLCRPEGSAAQSTQDMLKQMRSTVTEKIDGREYYIHTVKRGQTLYMISKAYGVDVNEVIRENPQVREGIKSDQKIRIPMPGQSKPDQKEQSQGDQQKNKAAAKAGAAEKQAKPVKKDTVVVVELPCGKDSTSKKAVYKVALMIPLFLGSVEGLATENPDPKILDEAPAFQFLPFYEGFRMALDSLESAGISVRLYVYDVDKDTARTRQIGRAHV